MGHLQVISNNIALGHTRLSIIDLSQNGNQPMHSKNQRYVILLMVKYIITRIKK